MSKFLDQNGLIHLWSKIKAYVTSALASLHYAGSAEAGGAATMAASIPFATLDASSTATSLIATVPGITELRDGVCFFLYNNVVASASGCTLNVNGLGAKPIYLMSSTRATTQVNKGYVWLLIYDSSRASAGGWRHGNLNNTTYSVIPTSELQAGTATTTRLITAARLHENYNITGGTINIAGQSITPLTAHQPIKTLSGIPLAGTGNVSLSFATDLATGHLSMTIGAAEAIDAGKVVATLEGEWSASKSYDMLCEVSYQGSSYVSKKSVPAGTLPTNTTYWQQCAQKGADGTNGKDGTNGTNGKDGADGADGHDAYQPFKGWFASESPLFAAYPTPQVGDYAYVMLGSAEVSGTVLIYACYEAGYWEPSGKSFNPANNQSFASGEELNTVSIIDRLDSSSPSDVLSAKQGKALILHIARSIGRKLISFTTSSGEQYVMAKTNISAGDTIVLEWECPTIGNLFSIERGDASYGYIETIYAVGSAETTSGTVVLVASSNIDSLRLFSRSTGFKAVAWGIKKDAQYYPLLFPEKAELDIQDTGVINGLNGQVKSDTAWYGSNCRFEVSSGVKITYKASYLDEGDGYAFYDENGDYISGGHWSDFTPPDDVVGDRSLVAPAGSAYCAVSWNRNIVSNTIQDITVDTSVPALSSTVASHDVAVRQMSDLADRFHNMESEVAQVTRKLTGTLLYQGRTSSDDDWLLPRVEITQGTRILVVWEHTQTGGVVSMSTADADWQEIQNFYYSASLPSIGGEVDVVMPGNSSTLRIFSSIGGLAVKVYRLDDNDKLEALNSLLEADAPTFEVSETGVITGSTGEVKTSTAWYGSNAKVPVTPGSIVTYMASYLDEGDGYAFYDESDVYISGGWWDDFAAPTDVTGERSMTAPSGAAWCRVSWNRNLVPASAQMITVDKRVSTLSLVVAQLSDKVADQSDASLKPYRGQKILSLGDSYTMHNYYGKYLAATTGCTQDARGYNGENLRQFTRDTYDTGSQPPTITEPFTSELLKSYDIVTIMGGTNDYGQGYPAGSITDDKEADSVAAHLKWLIDRIYTLNPDARIYVCTQPYRVPHPAFHDGLGAHIRNAGGSTLEDCMNIIVDICRYYSIPCFDFYHLSGWNEWTNRITNPDAGEPSKTNIYPPFDGNPHTIDGLHPRNGNGNGAEQLGRMFGLFINQH